MQLQSDPTQKRKPIVGVPVASSLNGVGFYSSSAKTLAADAYATLIAKVASARARYGLRDIELVRAVRSNNIVAVQSLLNMGVDPLAPRASHDGWTPTHEAVRLRNAKMLEVLISHVARNPDAGGIFYSADHTRHFTPLQVAIEDDNFSMAARMIAAGVGPVLSIDADGNTAMDTMVYKGQIDLLKLVSESRHQQAFKRPPHDDGLPLSFHAVSGQSRERFNVLDLLEQQGAPLAGNFGKNRTTLLHLAVACNDAEMVDFLIKKSGTDVNLMNKQGMTALHIAADRGYLNVVEKLISAGAETNVMSINDPDRDLVGATPLMLAAAGGNKMIVASLVSQPKTRIRIASENNGSTAIDYARQNGYPGIVVLLEDALSNQLARDIAEDKYQRVHALIAASKTHHAVAAAGK